MKTKYRQVFQMVLFGLILLAACAVIAAQTQAKFTDVQVRFVKADEMEMVNKDAELTIDDAAKRIRIKSEHRPLDASFDDVQKVVVEVNTFGKKAGFGASFAGFMAGGLLFGDMIATSIDKPFDNDHFVYLEVKKADSTTPYLLTVDKKSVPPLLKALSAAFGDRVTIPAYTERSEKIDEKKFDPPKIKIKAVSTEKQHPMPEIKPDRALVVVNCPATIMVRNRKEKSGFAMLIYANDKFISAVGPGNYVFFDIDPGEHLFVSDTPAPVGLRMKVEAGKDYYLTLTPYAKGFRMRSFLTRHSKELVMHEVGGSMWMDWRIEDKKD